MINLIISLWIFNVLIFILGIGIISWVNTRHSDCETLSVVAPSTIQTDDKTKLTESRPKGQKMRNIKNE